MLRTLDGHILTSGYLPFFIVLFVPIYADMYVHPYKPQCYCPRTSWSSFTTFLHYNLSSAHGHQFCGSARSHFLDFPFRPFPPGLFLQTFLLLSSFPSDVSHRIQCVILISLYISTFPYSCCILLRLNSS